MTEHPSHDEYLASIRAQAVECARSVLAARMTLIEGVRRLVALLRELDDSVLKSVHTSLIAVDSETDHLPVGPAREVWAPAAVAEKNREVAEAEARHRVRVAEACRQILHHLELIDCIGLERYRDECDK